MKNKKKLIISVILIILLIALIVFLVGRSFGFFRYVREGEITNIITINGIKVEIEDEENDALNLKDIYPMDDNQGMGLTPFVFTMNNTSSKDLTYSIRVDNDTEKQEACVLEDNTPCPVLTTDYIKYSYKKNDGTYTEPKILSSTDNIVASGTISSEETITSSIILWVDSEAGNEIQNHYFFGKVIITGETIN